MAEAPTSRTLSPWSIDSGGRRADDKGCERPSIRRPLRSNPAATQTPRCGRATVTLVVDGLRLNASRAPSRCVRPGIRGRGRLVLALLTLITILCRCLPATLCRSWAPLHQRQPMLIMTKAAAPCSGARAPTRAGAASCEDQPHPAQKGTWLGSHGAHEELSPGGQRSPARSGRAKLRQQQVSTAYASAKARRGCRRGCPASTPG